MNDTSMFTSGPRRPKPVADLQPGDVLHYDFRTADTRLSKSDDTVVVPILPHTFKVVQWNIERGARLSDIIRCLQACDADIIVLQELDIACRRSGYANVPEELARALSAELYFICEFIEYDAPTRSAMDCVGPLSPQGPAQEATEQQEENNDEKSILRHLHGNAILSRRVTMHYPYVIIHNSEPDWNTFGPLIGQPRKGARMTLRVTLQPPTPQQIPASTTTSTTNKAKKSSRKKRTMVTSSSTTATTSSSAAVVSDSTMESSSLITSEREVGPVHVYCCHFEIFCGSLTRLRQLADCMEDANSLLSFWQASFQDSEKQEKGKGEVVRVLPRPAFIIAGDLNTIAHGIVRFSRVVANDRLRLLSFGETEACWVQRKVLARNMDQVIRKAKQRDEKKEKAVSQGVHFSPLYYLRKAIFGTCDLFSRCYAWCTGNDFMWQWLYGFSQKEIAALDNSRLGFYDPTDKFRCITLDNPVYKGFVKGKLDWVLLSNLRLVAQPIHVNIPEDTHNDDKEEREKSAKDGTPCGVCLFNKAYKISDHKGLMVCLTQDGTSKDAAVYYPVGMNLYTSSFYARGWLVTTRLCLVLLLTLTIMRRWLTWRRALCGVCFTTGFVLHALAHQKRYCISLQL